MTVWHWVRHGPTHAKTFVGWRDIPADLSATDQINRLADALPSDAVVVSSDLIRASATADTIQRDRMRLPHSVMLREFNFGTWDNMGFDLVAKRHPKQSREYWESPGDVAPPGGESWNAAAKRVTTIVDHLNRTLTCKHIIAVAHIGVILTQVQRARQCSAADAISQKIDNLSLTTLDFSGPNPVEICVNHCP